MGSYLMGIINFLGMNLGRYSLLCLPHPPKPATKSRDLHLPLLTLLFLNFLFLPYLLLLDLAEGKLCNGGDL